MSDEKLPGFYRNDEIPLLDLGRGVSRKVLAYREGMMMVEVNFQTGSEGSVHTHPHHQISYVKNGVFEYSLDGVSKLMHEGDSIFIEPDRPHGCRCLEQGTLVDVFTPMRKDFLD